MERPPKGAVHQEVNRKKRTRERKTFPTGEGERKRFLAGGLGFEAFYLFRKRKRKDFPERREMDFTGMEAGEGGCF